MVMPGGTSSLFVVVLLLSEYSSGLLSFSKEVALVISLTQVLIWIVIAAVIGFVGELLARRRAPDGIVGTILLGLLAISLIVGIFHFHIPGEPFLGGIPLLSSIIAAALIGVWLLTKVIILTGIGDINVAGVPIRKRADRRNHLGGSLASPNIPRMAPSPSS
jgi:uncharacterized membrane protein YeaQ/YmgE (transglycosylase-associated protein family)